MARSSEPALISTTVQEKEQSRSGKQLFIRKAPEITPRASVDRYLPLSFTEVFRIPTPI
jgi:hypothetical protein